LKYTYIDSDQSFDKVYIIGNGESINFFDSSYIDKRSIVISNIECIKEYCDFVIVSSLDFLKSENITKILDLLNANNPKVLLYKDLLFNIKLDNSITDDQKKIFDTVLRQNIYLINSINDNQMFTSTSDILSKMDEGFLYGIEDYYLSLFSFSYYIRFKYNIHKVFYSGIDYFKENQVMLGSEDKSFFNLLFLLGMNAKYYNNVQSLSFLDLCFFEYDFLNQSRQDYIKTNYNLDKFAVNLSERINSKYNISAMVDYRIERLKNKDDLPDKSFYYLNQKNKDYDYENLFIVGPGFSLDMFDTNIINDNDLVICANGSVCAVPHVDYYIASNWINLRKSITQYIPEDKKIICYSGTNSSGMVYNRDTIPKSSGSTPEILNFLTKMILHRCPEFVYFYIDKSVLNNPKRISKMGEKNQFPGMCGASSFCFAYALYLTQLYRIPNVFYVGFDFVQLKFNSQEFNFPFCVKKTMNGVAKYLDSNFPYSTYNGKINVFHNYKHQLISTLLTVSLSKEFYEKLINYSMFDIKQFTFTQLDGLRNRAIKLLDQHKVRTFNQDMLIDLYNFMGLNSYELQSARILKEMDKGILKRNRIIVEPKYKRTIPYGFLGEG
jgi:hypothetical protein